MAAIDAHLDDILTHMSICAEPILLPAEGMEARACRLAGSTQHAAGTQN
ncbi:MAG: hypothetical protein M9947_14290 [Thermomicrobiales bacterium]|nr:hypothetical protein [Thermomicrobiales bacterium]